MPRGNPNPSPKTRFQKGVSGNPGGFPANVMELRAKAVVHTAVIREALLRQYAEMAARGDLLPLDAVLLMAGRDAENRQEGTPKQTQTAEVQGELVIKWQS